MNDTIPFKNIVEAALMAAGEPLPLERLQLLFDEHERPDKNHLKAIIEELFHDYQDRGLELAELASGYAIRVRQDYAPWVARLWEEKPQRHTRAFLETLALIAYRQPITRAEIEKVRGVTVSSNIIKTLLDRGWIKIVGYRDLPGKPGLYATTKIFLDYFSLKSLSDLPALDEILDLDKAANQLELALKGEVETEMKTESEAQEQSLIVEEEVLVEPTQ